MPHNDKRITKKLKSFFLHPATLAVLCVLVGCGGGFWIGRATGPKPTTVSGIHIANSQFKFVSPLLGVDVGDPKDFTEFKPFEAKVKQTIAQLESQGQVTDVGFYFRDFTTGHWVGVNENDQFYPASLLKVPLMIAYYKESETDSALLSQKLTFPAGSSDANQVEYIKPTQAIQPGQSYTIEQLIEYMIEYSDNNAANLLVGNIDQNSFNEIYSDLGISLPNETETETDFLTPKQYSLFFRILRNGTYLTDELSEQALELLSKSDYSAGLTAGVPPGTTISQKFGEHLLEQANGQQVNEFHDCGIVYTAKTPYLLCIMTKGSDYTAQQNAIKQLSALTYSEVANNFK